MDRHANRLDLLITADKTGRASFESLSLHVCYHCYAQEREERPRKSTFLALDAT